jgi:transposase
LQPEHKSGPNSFQVIEAKVSQPDASPAVGRRRWSAAAKERIVAEAMVPGANVSEIARAHGLSPQQVFEWRRRSARAGGDGRDTGMGPTFAAVELVDSEAGGTVELVVGDVVIRVGPAVTIGRLQAILRAVRSA